MDPLLDLALRWTHFIAGIIWVGHNYSSVVQRPGWRPLAAADLTDDTSPRFQALLNREHGFFRWASVVAWSAGLLMLFRHRASLGGVNILALWAQERLGWRAGWVQMGLDGAIVLAAIGTASAQVVVASLLGALVLNASLALNHRPERYVAM